MNAITLLMIDLGLRSSAILIVVFALFAAFRRASAGTRSAAWRVGFLLLALLPLTYYFEPPWCLTVAEMAPPPSREQSIFNTPAELDAANNLYGGRSMMETLEESRPGVTWIVIWMAGAGVLLMRRFISGRQLRKLARQTTHLTPKSRQGRMCKHLATSLGISRRVRLRHGPTLAVPVTWGIRRPVIALPTSSSDWAEVRLEAALLHELGHIRNRDAFSRLLATVVQAFYWPNPLVWIAARAWRTAQEQACDDHVLLKGTPADTYAHQLVEAARTLAVARQRLGTALALARPSTLEQRITAILNPRVNHQPVSRSTWFKISTGGVLCLTLLTMVQIRGLAAPAEDFSKGNPTEIHDLAERTVLPELKLRMATLQEAVSAIRLKIVEASPEKRPLKITVTHLSERERQTRMSVDFIQIPLHEALNYITQLAGVKFSYVENEVLIEGTEPASD
ncbi:M56 family metallopeptidase [Verrucomicrobium spinosum]|uniref:M56 family metallopeptidase n=1 Tax=Verrucomicrobium spinosum TaxID=2736 RepID=UPI00017444A2|nr:M56 family metallopeptidase [Verrucomicrobium spinosum]